MSRTTLILALVVVSAGTAPASARQQQRPVYEEKFEVLESPPPASLEEMGQQSLAIAVATYVGDVTPGNAPRRARRLHEFRLDQVLKDQTGKLPTTGSEFTLLLHGGRAERPNEIRVYKVVDVEALRESQQYLLFLSVNPHTEDLMPAWGTGSVFNVVGNRLKGLRKFGSALDGLDLSVVLGRLQRIG